MNDASENNLVRLRLAVGNILVQCELELIRLAQEAKKAFGWATAPVPPLVGAAKRLGDRCRVQSQHAKTRSASEAHRLNDPLPGVQIDGSLALVQP